VVLVGTDVLEEDVTSIISVKRIRVIWLLVAGNVSPSSPILVTLMIEAISSSETLVHARVTGRHTPDDGIPNTHRRENRKSYI
jgi:hypothetical protein